MKRTRKLLDQQIEKLNANGHSLFVDKTVTGYMVYTASQSKRLSNYLTLRETWHWLDAYRYGHEIARTFPKTGFYKVSRFDNGSQFHWTSAERGARSTVSNLPMTGMEAETFQDMLKRKVWTTMTPCSLYRIVPE